MVPCPECKVPQLYRFKPKAGAKRRQCDACRAKRRQREQVRKESLHKHRAARCVPCAECDNEMELPNTRAVERAAVQDAALGTRSGCT